MNSVSKSMAAKNPISALKKEQGAWPWPRKKEKKEKKGKCKGGSCPAWSSNKKKDKGGRY